MISMKWLKRLVLAGACSLALSGWAQAEEIVMDLGAETDEFAPYVNERHPAWALLPALAIAIVLLHLRKAKPARAKVRKVEGS
jgi:hypothetical protein